MALHERVRIQRAWAAVGHWGCPVRCHLLRPHPPGSALPPHLSCLLRMCPGAHARPACPRPGPAATRYTSSSRLSATKAWLPTRWAAALLTRTPGGQGAAAAGMPNFLVPWCPGGLVPASKQLSTRCPLLSSPVCAKRCGACSFNRAQPPARGADPRPAPAPSRSMRRFWSVVLPFTFASPVGIFLGFVVSDVARGVGAASISALASGARCLLGRGHVCAGLLCGVVDEPWGVGGGGSWRACCARTPAPPASCHDGPA